MAMQEVVIVAAVRSPIGRRKGGLAGLHPADLLGTVQKAAVMRAGVDPAAVGQIVGGCVSQVGEQSYDVARTALFLIRDAGFITGQVLAVDGGRWVVM